MLRHRNTEKEKKRAYGKRKRPNEGTSENGTEEDSNEQEQNGEYNSNSKDDSETEVMEFPAFVICRNVIFTKANLFPRLLSYFSTSRKEGQETFIYLKGLSARCKTKCSEGTFCLEL